MGFSCPFLETFSGTANVHTLTMIQFLPLIFDGFSKKKKSSILTKRTPHKSAHIYEYNNVLSSSVQKKNALFR